jgi:hypothetical protein
MDRWIVYESMFGNTRAIAEAIASGMGERVAIMSVDDAPAVVPPSVGLVVAGGPTHALGMSRATTREEALTKGATAPRGPRTGLREWLETVKMEPTTKFATFDTKIAKMRHLPGSAARAAARAMSRGGHRTIVKPTSFYVRDIDGPLLDGEIDRANHWGSDLDSAAATSDSE